MAKKRSKLKYFLQFHIAPFLMAMILKFIRFTMRIDFVNKKYMEELVINRQNFIMTFWHNRLLLMPYGYSGEKVYVMVSMHRDGLMTTKLFSHFGVNSIQGSSTKGGTKALRQMVRIARSRADLGFTPDGPKGPPCYAKSGVVLAAKLTGMPILPVSFASSRKWVFRSWDRMQMPRPFSRGVFTYGKPIYVDKNIRGKEIENIRKMLEEQLNVLMNDADRYLIKKDKNLNESGEAVR